MDLPVVPPVSPMLARPARVLPAGDWRYEPKWDGFRCVAFVSGSEVELGSRNERPLTRYFPEVAAALGPLGGRRCVLDGELVVAGADGLDFDALSQRVHPAASRVAVLAEATPAAFVAFDLLALGDLDLRPAPFEQRRARLEELLAGALPGVHLTPMTAERDVAAHWFARFEGAGLDGIVAKDPRLAYLEGRRVMVKVKHERTAELVVGGFRWYRGETGEGVGSLLLGLYDAAGVLRQVGVIGAFPAAERVELVGKLAPYRTDGDHPWVAPDAPPPGTGVAEGSGVAVRPGVAARTPASRWRAGADPGFEALRPELVVEAAYDHMQGDRLRHTARFRRWRPDRRPEECTFSQLEVAAPALLDEVFSSRG